MNDFLNIRAKKSLWQNFLIDENILQIIANSSEISDKNIIEVGPGYGALTDFIIEKNPKNLDLVELDDDMIKILEKKFRDFYPDFVDKITIHHIDVLEFLPKYSNYSLIANIPYYITSPILFHFLYNPNFANPEEMVILMQKEVGEKILENLKKPKFSYLSLAMYQACEGIEKIVFVPSEAFNPAPKVDSIVLKFVTKKNRNLDFDLKMLDFWDICFAQPRKTLISNLKSANFDSKKILSILENLWYSASIRAEAIRKEDWQKIFAEIYN